MVRLVSIEQEKKPAHALVLQATMNPSAATCPMKREPADTAVLPWIMKAYQAAIQRAWTRLEPIQDL